MISVAKRRELYQADGLPKRHDTWDCRLCDFSGVLGSHLRYAHPEINYKEYVERFHPKFCEVCSTKIPFNREQYRYAVVRYCSKTCSAVGRGKKLTGRFTGDKSRNWRGGRFMAGGYVNVIIHALPEPLRSWAVEMAKDRKDAVGQRYILEHRIVMAEKLGRPLDRTEGVHHINARRSDNRPENLELRVGAHGQGATGGYITCPHCDKAFVPPPQEREASGA